MVTPAEPADAARARDEAAEPDPHPRLHKLEAAAIEAELRTGKREESVEAAKTHIVIRVAWMSFGFILVVLGIILLPLPGPGWLVIAAGLVVLAQDFVWAERTLAIVRNRLPQDADGKIAPKTWIIMAVMATLGIAASLWWTLWR